MIKPLSSGIFFFLLSSFVFSTAADQTKLNLSSDWHFIRTSDHVSTWKLKTDPQTIIVFQSHEKTNEIDWTNTDSSAFFQKFKKQKQQIFDMIGISEWTAFDHQWNKKKNHFELIIKGSYKNSGEDLVFFHEYHIFFKKSTHQILITSPNLELINTNKAQHSIDKIKQHLITHTKDFESSNLSLLNGIHTNFIINNTRTLLSFCVPTAHAYNNECKECLDQTTELTDAKNICQVLLNSPPCLKVPKDKKAHCNYTDQAQNTEFEQSSIWDYVRGCTTGVANSVTKVLRFTWNFMKSFMNDITGQQKSNTIKYKLTEYVNNVKLYLHTEFEKRYDRNKTGVGRAVSAIKAVGGTIGNMFFKSVFNMVFGGLKKMPCLNSRGKSESFCEFVSNAFMMSTNYISILAQGEHFLTVKQISTLDEIFDKVNTSLQKQNNISAQNFKQLTTAEDTLNKPLSKTQKQEIVYLSNTIKKTNPITDKTNEIDNKDISQNKNKGESTNRYTSPISRAEQALNRSLSTSQKRTLMQLSHARRDVAKRRLKRKGFKSHEIDKLFEVGVL